jgi:hypothetical protein
VKDAVVVAVLVASFAALVTTHLAVAVRLTWRRPRYRGLVALIVPPLAPLWAYEAGWRRLSWLWVGAVAVYAAAVAVAMV